MTTRPRSTRSTPPTIRNATRADLAGLVRLEQSCFPPEDAFSRRQYRDLLANPRANVRVIRQSGMPIASAVLLRRRVRKRVRKRGHLPFPSGRLYSIAVHPDARGRGLGQRLLADAIRACRREGIPALHLEVRAANAPAIALYRKFGFHIERDLPDYYGPGQHGVKMRLGLGA